METGETQFSLFMANIASDEQNEGAEASGDAL